MFRLPIPLTVFELETFGLLRMLTEDHESATESRTWQEINEDKVKERREEHIQRMENRSDWRTNGFFAARKDK